MDATDIGPYFAELARRLLEVEGTQATMDLIVHAAVEAIDGCDHVSLSHMRGKELRSAASDDAMGPTLDRIQTETQEGPCLDAIRYGGVLTCGDLRRDPRWAAYGPRAVAETGVVSSMAAELHDGRRTVGALNLFSTERDAFPGDAEQEALVAIFTAHATPALAAALFREDMANALRNRDVIGQAKGMLMVRSDVDEDTAFGLLVTASQRMNVKLVEVARRLVAGSLPDEP